jgi:hypothetical protein
MSRYFYIYEEYYGLDGVVFYCTDHVGERVTSVFLLFLCIFGLSSMNLFMHKAHFGYLRGSEHPRLLVLRRVFLLPSATN